MSEYMTTAEVAALVRAPASTVRYWRQIGTGPRGFKIGKRVVYREESVTAWLDEQERADAAGGAA